MTMRHFDAAAIEAATPYPVLIEAIGEAFREDGTSPNRHHHEIPTGTGDDGTLLIMPSWSDGGQFGVKLATVYPMNSAKDLPTVNGLYVLFDSETGVPQATFDAAMLTARRTAAASAFAASKLARPDAASMLMIGTGRLSHNLIEAHSTVRPIRNIRVWGRSQSKAAAVVEKVRGSCNAVVAVATDLEAACREADIISAATLAREPLIRGSWLEPGVHIDLVGSFTPDMRETDTDVFRRANVVYVDTLEGAQTEAGDILAAVDDGAIGWDALVGSLDDLARTDDLARPGAHEITVFKSVGVGLEDLAAARLCFKAVS